LEALKAAGEKKNVQQPQDDKPKRGRGRPRKNPVDQAPDGEELLPQPESDDSPGGGSDEGSDGEFDGTEDEIDLKDAAIKEASQAIARISKFGKPPLMARVTTICSQHGCGRGQDPKAASLEALNTILEELANIEAEAADDASGGGSAGVPASGLIQGATQAANDRAAAKSRT